MLKFKELPSSEKPRERLIRHGADVLSDSELLAIILRNGYKDVTVKSLSDRILQQYGLRKLFSMGVSELKEIKGIGESKACEILAISELSSRIKKASVKRISITSPEEAVAECEEIRTKEKEHLIGLYLNTRNKLLAKELLSIGNLDSSIVDPKEVYKYALRLNAYGVILLHNHPSGEAKPSREDVNITRIIKKAGKLLNVTLIDHIVVGDKDFVSMKEQGLI